MDLGFSFKGCESKQVVGFWGEIPYCHGGLGWTHNFHVKFGSGSRVSIWVLKADPSMMGTTAPKTIYVGLRLAPSWNQGLDSRKSIIVFCFYSIIGCECKPEINPLLFEIEIVNGI